MGQKEQTDGKLQLDFRFSLGAGVGRYLVQTNRSQFGLSGGLAGNREHYSETEAKTKVDRSAWTAEAVLDATYEFFLFGDHETRLSTSLTVLPNISDWGRYRIEVSSTFRREFFNDFTLGVSFFDTYDSDPPVEGAEKNDIRIQTTLGWTF